MDEKKREEIAVFRYGIIAAVLHGGAERQSEYFRRLAQTRLQAPHLGPRQYSVPTFKSWLRSYRSQGLEGLKPKSRCDCGRPRVISEALSQAIGRLLADHPRMGVPQLRQSLLQQGLISSRSPSPATLRRHIAQAGLRPARPEPPGRKPFEKPHANDMWTVDFMHGPKLPRSGRRRAAKTYLLAAIDDHSRFVTAAAFYAQENAAVLSQALQQAFLRHGLPQILYCDNGSAFSSANTARACAQLGVALVHSKPYDSPSRGKIERYFGTVRRCFLDARSFEHLDDLNDRFRKWLEQDYHRKAHSSTGERPLDRYMRSLARTRRPAPARQELEWVFYRELTRRVRNDCTVSIRCALWEVPSRYIGQKVSIRHPEGAPEDLHLFEENTPVCRLHRVRLAENANQPPALRFSLQPGRKEEEKP